MQEKNGNFSKISFKSSLSPQKCGKKHEKKAGSLEPDVHL